MSILEQMTQTLLPLHLYALSPGSSVLAELSAYAQSLEKAAQRLERLPQAAFIQTAPSPRLEEDVSAHNIRLLFAGNAGTLTDCAPAVHAIERSLPAQLKIWADLPAENWDALDAAGTPFNVWDALSLRWELQEDTE